MNDNLKCISSKMSFDSLFVKHDNFSTEIQLSLDSQAPTAWLVAWLKFRKEFSKGQNKCGGIATEFFSRCLSFCNNWKNRELVVLERLECGLADSQDQPKREIRPRHLNDGVDWERKQIDQKECIDFWFYGDWTFPQLHDIMSAIIQAAGSFLNNSGEISSVKFNPLDHGLAITLVSKLAI